MMFLLLFTYLPTYDYRHLNSPGNHLWNVALLTVAEVVAGWLYKHFVAVLSLAESVVAKQVIYTFCVIVMYRYRAYTVVTFKNI